MGKVEAKSSLTFSNEQLVTSHLKQKKIAKKELEEKSNDNEGAKMDFLI